jgi:hypothetical protein
LKLIFATYLREAITNNHEEIWTALLDIPNINPNLCDENGRTALHVANWFNKVNIYYTMNK